MFNFSWPAGFFSPRPFYWPVLFSPIEKVRVFSLPVLFLTRPLFFHLKMRAFSWPVLFAWPVLFSRRRDAGFFFTDRPFACPILWSLKRCGRFSPPSLLLVPSVYLRRHAGVFSRPVLFARPVLSLLSSHPFSDPFHRNFALLGLPSPISNFTYSLFPWVLQEVPPPPYSP